MKVSLDKKITLKSIAVFVAPSIIMMIFMSIYSIVDGIVAARFVNTDAFAAINIVYPLLSIVIAIGTMFGTGATAIVSLLLGAKKEQEARQKLTFVVCVTVLIGIVIAVIIMLCLRPILLALGADESIYQYCYDYAFPQIFILPFIILQLQFQYYYVAEGKPSLGMITTIIGGVVNIVLDCLLTAVFQMGVTGVAIASGLGYTLSALIGLVYFWNNKKGTLYFVKPVVDCKMLFRTMANGSSEMVSNLSASVTTILFNVVMMHYIGKDGVAAMGVVLYLDFILISASLGFSAGVAPLISYNYGAGNQSRLKELYRINSRICILSGLLVTVGAIAFREPLILLFAGRGSEVFTLAVTGMLIYAFSYLLKPINVYYSAMFTAYSNGGVSAFLSLMRTLVLIVLTVLTFVWLFGIVGIWYAVPVAEFVSFLIGRVAVGKYKKAYYLT